MHMLSADGEALMLRTSGDWVEDEHRSCCTGVQCSKRSLSRHGYVVRLFQHNDGELV